MCLIVVCQCLLLLLVYIFQEWKNCGYLLFVPSLFSYLLLKMIPLDSFMVHSADGRLVPVVPGGQNIPLTFANRTEYVERGLDYKLHEMDSQV